MNSDPALATTSNREPDLEPRLIPIPHGRQIVVRPVGARDEGALSDLYDGLDAEDRYLRFFCTYRPRPEFFEQLANPGPRESRVVAELSGPTGRRLVAEAGYSLLANGNGEFAMVVAREWRGWLEPYLLDLVAEQAAHHQVPNLEADVLAADRKTTALLRSRGGVVVDRDGWNEYRMMVGTGEDGPTWPVGADRPRVLVETSGGHWPFEEQARSAGLQVVTCYGPVQNPSCPELSGRRCPLASGADAVVVRSPACDPRWEDMTSAHSRLNPDVPVVIELGGRADDAVTLDDVRVPAFVHYHLHTSANSRVSNDAP